MSAVRYMILTTMTHTIDIPLDGYLELADVVSRFAGAVETLLTHEFAYPFPIGSEALRDCTADAQHRGTRSTQALTQLATGQIHAGFVQCDLLLGIAACLPAHSVFFAPFPLARACVAVAARAWHVIAAESREDRLKHYLNEELAALYDASFDRADKETEEHIRQTTNDFLAVGAAAGLRAVPGPKSKPWVAPYLVSRGQKSSQRPLKETDLVKALFVAGGFKEAVAHRPYKVLSAAAHGRFRYAGVVSLPPTGPSVHGVSMRSMHTPVDVAAEVTAPAALATLTHLRALARYVNVPEVTVQERLQDTLTQ